MARIVVVDENDEFLEYRERSERGAGGVARVTALWMTNSIGEILIARRALEKARDPGLWGPAVAGTVEEGEEYDTNIVKEIEEELGLSVVLEDLMRGPKVAPGGVQGAFIQWYYLTRDLSIPEFKLQPEEVMEVKWVEKASLIEEFTANPQSFVPSMPRWLPAVLSHQRRFG